MDNLEKAKIDYPVGTKIISLFGAKDTIKDIPYADKYGEIYVLCIRETRLICNDKNTWAEIIK